MWPWVGGLFGLLYDPAHRYRVEHRPASAWGMWHNHAVDGDFGKENAEWLESLLRDDVDAEIVY